MSSKMNVFPCRMIKKPLDHKLWEDAFACPLTLKNFYFPIAEYSFDKSFILTNNHFLLNPPPSPPKSRWNIEQSWACDNTTATTWPCFQATVKTVDNGIMPIFVLASPFRRLHCCHNFLYFWSSIALTCCHNCR